MKPRQRQWRGASPVFVSLHHTYQYMLFHSRHVNTRCCTVLGQAEMCQRGQLLVGTANRGVRWGIPARLVAGMKNNASMSGCEDEEV